MMAFESTPEACAFSIDEILRASVQARTSDGYSNDNCMTRAHSFPSIAPYQIHYIESDFVFSEYAIKILLEKPKRRMRVEQPFLRGTSTAGFLAYCPYPTRSDI